MPSRRAGNGSLPSIAIWTTAVTSPASAPSIAKPRICCDLASTTAFRNPRVSASVRARGMADADTLATLISKPLFRASRSVNPIRPSSGSMKTVCGMSRSDVLLPPSPNALSFTMRQSSRETLRLLRAAGAVAQCPGERRRGLEPIIDADEALRIQLNTSCIQPNVARHGDSADGHQKIAAVEALLILWLLQASVHVLA